MMDRMGGMEGSVGWREDEREFREGRMSHRRPQSGSDTNRRNPDPRSG